MPLWTTEARSSYEKALALQQEPERKFLQERIRRLKKNSSEADADIEINSAKHSPKARRKKNFLDDVSNSGPAVDYMVTAGQLARPKT